MRIWLPLLYGVVALATLACGFTSPSPTPTPSPTEVPLPPGAVVFNADIENFTQEDVQIAVGTTIIWTNRDGVLHTTSHNPPTGGEGDWDSGNLGSGSTFRHTFNEAGVFPYVCKVHTITMKATITVVAGAG
jgi:plastocyanin